MFDEFIDINPCYVLGTSLSSLNSISFDELKNVGDHLIRKKYNVDVSVDRIKEVVDEWKDFFVIDFDKKQININNNANKELLLMIFYEMLDKDVRDDILDAVVNRDKKPKGAQIIEIDFNQKHI